MISPSLSDVSVCDRTPAERIHRTNTANPETVRDAELVTRFNSGDETAFATIIQLYRGKMFAVAFSLLRNEADAEEIAQDTFIRAYHGLIRFRGDSSLATWLYRIALNLSRNRYWYFHRRKRHATQSLDCAVSADNPTTYADLVASEAPCPAREATNQEFSVLVADCMTKLSANQCEILTLRNVRQHSYQHIAQTLGISVGTVKSRIARARENLRQRLAEKMNTDAEQGTASLSHWFERKQPAGSSCSTRWTIATC